MFTIGYFDLINTADLFVFMDNVQLAKRSWQVRNRIKSSQGELFLSIPIKKLKSRDETNICDAVIDDSSGWRDKHTRSIELAYRNAPFFSDVYLFLKTNRRIDLLLSSAFLPFQVSKRVCFLSKTRQGRQGVSRIE